MVNYSTSSIVSPCIPTCPHRIGGCKIWCEEYEEYNKLKVQEEIDKSERVNKHHAISYRSMLT